MRLASRAKKRPSGVLLSIILATCILSAYGVLFVTSDKGLNFLTTVAHLDVAHYSVKVSTMNLSPEEKVVKYTLTSADSNVDVLTRVRDGRLVQCKLYPMKGSPRFFDPTPTNSLTGSKILLERLRTYFVNLYIPIIPNEIHFHANEFGSFLKPAETNVTMKLKVINSRFEFQWSYTPLDIEDVYKVVALTTDNGTFIDYSNNWNLYQIGNTNVNINREQAIQIANEGAMEKFSLYHNQTRPEIASAELSMQNRGNNVLYPQWNILLPLDKAYGAIGCVRILVWADTGNADVMQGV